MSPGDKTSWSLGGLTNACASQGRRAWEIKCRFLVLALIAFTVWKLWDNPVDACKAGVPQNLLCNTGSVDEADANDPSFLATYAIFRNWLREHNAEKVFDKPDIQPMDVEKRTSHKRTVTNEVASPPAGDGQSPAKTTESKTTIEYTTTAESPNDDAIKFLSRASSGRVIWLVSYFAMVVFMLGGIIYCLYLFEFMNASDMEAREANILQIFCCLGTIGLYYILQWFAPNGRLMIKSLAIEGYIKNHIAENAQNVLRLTDALFVGFLFSVVALSVLIVGTFPRWPSLGTKPKANAPQRDHDEYRQKETELPNKKVEAIAKRIQRLTLVRQWISHLGIVSAIVLAALVFHARSFMVLPLAPLGGCEAKSIPGVGEYCTSIAEMQAAYGALASIIVALVFLPLTVFHKSVVTVMLADPDPVVTAEKPRIKELQLTFGEQIQKYATIVLPLLSGTVASFVTTLAQKAPS